MRCSPGRVKINWTSSQGHDERDGFEVALVVRIAEHEARRWDTFMGNAEDLVDNDQLEQESMDSLVGLVIFSPNSLNLSYSGLEKFQQPEFEGYGPKPSKSISEDTLMRSKQQEKPVRKPVKYAEIYRLTAISIKGNGGGIWGEEPKERKLLVNELLKLLELLSKMVLLKGEIGTLIVAARTISPHNKTPYELFRGRTPALSFMRPFGCHVTILNTLDYLGKFDGKSDEGFFVGYSMNSKAFRVYNIRTRKVEENLHIRFLEDKPIIAGDGLKWLFDIDVLTKSMNYVPVVAGTNSNDSVGTEESIGTGHSSKETGSSQDYILMPMWKDGSLFDSSSKNASNDELQPSSDVGKKDDEGVSQESRIDDQERPENSTQDVNTARPSINTANTNINTGSLNINIVSPTATTAPLEATHADFFGDETKLDMSNITTTYLVYTTPNTRIYKDHSLDHVIGDVQSVEPKKVIQALTDPSWIEAMQDEYLQFKLQKVWTLLDLPYGKRAIGTKWVYRNTKDERVARIEAIRLFLAYASFKDFVVYQMDVKSAFLYGKIEEEVHVCQPLGFEDPEFPNRVYKVEKALYGLHQAPRASLQVHHETSEPYSRSKAEDVDVIYIDNDWAH
ncbi:putative ribonuclease H-like domain-containing protein [Tanacetum coccineum]|uniref:Ribonuclease H-like domain-containing protein n=1 Tax=Tanacetum coccineum TaxID=301880 RepID=A0ABQ5CM26_9ASTR